MDRSQTSVDESVRFKARNKIRKVVVNRYALLQERLLNDKDLQEIGGRKVLTLSSGIHDMRSNAYDYKTGACVDVYLNYGFKRGFKLSYRMFDESVLVARYFTSSSMTSGAERECLLTDLRNNQMWLKQALNDIGIDLSFRLNQKQGVYELELVKIN